ncbi:MAG: phospholipase C/P1 nuclease family protein [Caulobacteraceae bacterium]
MIKLCAGSALILCTLLPAQAFAWGATGHREIGRLAVEALPAELPAFLRTADVAQEIGEIAREPDRSKGSGTPHDADLDPGHFLNVDDQGKIKGGPALASLPPTREAFDQALQAVGTDSGKIGYLPYNIEDGFQQLTRDFGYWRVETAALKTERDPANRAYLQTDRRLREALIIRDLGYWAHFVGDGSQPMHVSIHYNGWGDYLNPQGFTQDKIHAPFEGAFIHDHVPPEQVRAAMRPYRSCIGGIAACTAAYLAATGTQVAPLYTLWGQGGFVDGDKRGQAFAAARVADGASELRDLIVDAWRASGQDTVGYKPSITVKDAEAGATVDMAMLKGSD